MTSRELFHSVRLRPSRNGKAANGTSSATGSNAGKPDGRTEAEDAAVAEIVAFAPPEMFCQELRDWARQFFVDRRAANERGHEQ